MRIPLACLATVACISAAPAPSVPDRSAPSFVQQRSDLCAQRAIHARTVNGRAVVRGELVSPGTSQPVNLYLAVDRREGGCPVPLIAQQGVRGAEPSQGWIHR